MRYFDWTFSDELLGLRFIDEPHLQDGTVVDAWNFKSCNRLEFKSSLCANVIQSGRRAVVEFGAFGLPYLEERLASAIAERFPNQVQLLPVKIGEHGEIKFLLNALRSVACIDERRSVFTKWEVGNPERPDKAGQYRSVSDLHIDPSLTRDLDILRPWGWHVAIIVSERVVELVDRHAHNESSFLPVVDI